MHEDSFYGVQARFLIAVDCTILGFIDNEIKLLTFRRKIEPKKGGLSLLGGFMNENENIDQAASRVLKTLTGLDNIYMQQVKAYGNVDRDPGERVISVTYYALINVTDYANSLLPESDLEWISLDRKRELIFDHEQMLDDAILLLRRHAALHPIGFNLLLEKFTLTQLQSLYESIYGETMDKRNFRKKILGMDILERLDEKDKKSSKRGAYYYVFNRQRYESMLDKGFVFTM